MTARAGDDIGTPRLNLAAIELERSNVERLAWRHWVLFALTTVCTTVGLSVAIVSLLKDGLSTIWPWEHTEFVLVAGLSVVVSLFSTYLTLLQRRLQGLRRRLQHLQQQSIERDQRHYDRLMALLNLSRIMGSETNLQAVFDSITKTCLEIFESEQVSLMLVDPSSKELRVASANGHTNLDKVLQARHRVGQGIAGWVAQHGKPLILGPNVPPEYAGHQPREVSLSAAMIVPILVRRELVGVLNVASRSARIEYDERDLKALEVFAENAGICIRHTEHAEWMRRTIDSLDAQLQRRRGPQVATNWRADSARDALALSTAGVDQARPPDEPPGP